MSDWEAGDIAKRHVPRKEGGSHPQKNPPRVSYGVRYRKRFKPCVIVMGLLMALGALAPNPYDQTGLVLVVDLVARFVLGGLVFGALVNLLVALIPGRAETIARPRPAVAAAHAGSSGVYVSEASSRVPGGGTQLKLTIGIPAVFLVLLLIGWLSGRSPGGETEGSSDCDGVAEEAASLASDAKASTAAWREFVQRTPVITTEQQLAERNVLRAEFEADGRAYVAYVLDNRECAPDAIVEEAESLDRMMNG